MNTTTTSLGRTRMDVEKLTVAQSVQSYRRYRIDRKELRALLDHGDQMLQDVGVSRSEVQHLLGLSFRAYRARFEF